MHDHGVAGRLGHEHVVHVGLDSARRELAGKDSSDLLEQRAVARSAAVEKRQLPANLLGKFIVGEPRKFSNITGTESASCSSKSTVARLFLTVKRKLTRENTPR